MAIVSFGHLELPIPKDRLTPELKRELLTNVSALLFSQRLEVFNDQGGLSSWEPLSRSYAARKLARYGGKSSKILSASNALRVSFTAEGGPGAPGKEIEITEDSARISTHVRYAAIHNYGGTVRVPETRNGFGRGITIPAHAVTIPARPFDEFRPQDEADVLELVRGFVNGQ